MGLSLCHTIPRDPLVRLVYFLGLVAFTLLLAGLAASRSTGTDGVPWSVTLFPSDPTIGALGGNVFATVRGQELRLVATPGSSSTGEYQSLSSATLCPVSSNSTFALAAAQGLADVATANSECTNSMLPMLRASLSFYMITCLSLFLIWLFFACLRGQQTIHKNTVLYVAVVVLTSIPTATCIIATAVFDQAQSHATRLSQLAWRVMVTTGTTGLPNLANPAATLTFTSRPSTSYILFIIATACLCLMWVCTVVRLVTFMNVNKTLKARVVEMDHKKQPDATPSVRGAASLTSEHFSNVAANANNGHTDEPPAADPSPNPTNATSNFSFELPHNRSNCHRFLVDERLDNRVVNDDWARQQEIWIQRRLALAGAFRNLEEQGCASSQRGASASRSRPAHEDANSVAVGGSVEKIELSSELHGPTTDAPSPNAQPRVGEEASS